MTHPPLSGLASSPSSQGFGTLQVLPAAPAHWAEGTVSPPRAATAASSSSSSLRHLQVTTPACPEPLSIQAPALARHLVSAQRSGHISLYRAYGPWQGHPTSDPCPQPRHHPNRPACTEPAACPVCCLLPAAPWAVPVAHHPLPQSLSARHGTVPWHGQLLSPLCPCRARCCHLTPPPFLGTTSGTRPRPCGTSRRNAEVGKQLPGCTH